MAKPLFQPEPGTPFADTPLLLNWMAVFHHYLPELRYHYINEYTSVRSSARKLENQADYLPDLTRYDASFWDEVIQEHITYLFSIYTTTETLYRITGGCTSWPDVIRRLPGLLRTNPVLMERVFIPTHAVPPLGAFMHCSSPQIVNELIRLIHREDLDITGSVHTHYLDPANNATAIWYYMMQERHWLRLREDPLARTAVARMLDRMLDESHLLILEALMAPLLQGFFNWIATSPPYVPPPET